MLRGSNWPVLDNGVEQVSLALHCKYVIEETLGAHIASVFNAFAPTKSAFEKIPIVAIVYEQYSDFWNAINPSSNGKEEVKYHFSLK